MEGILEYLTNAKVMELASDTRVLFAAGVLFILALILRWKFVIALLFGLAGTNGDIKYANLGEGEASINQNLVTFGVGTVIVAAVLIYYLFIRSD